MYHPAQRTQYSFRRFLSGIASAGLSLLLAALIMLASSGLTPAFAACTDGDGDGYGNPGSADCTHPQTDCNDGNAAVHPGAVEKCNGVNDDCDGATDEGFTFFGLNQVNHMVENLPLGFACVQGNGICEALGTVVCSIDQLSAVCSAVPLAPGVEGPTGSANCFDFSDNDCDGLADHQDVDCQGPERCDGFDNDNDGMTDEDFMLGVACSAGVGLCASNGVTICSSDHLSVMCTAVPSSPKNEGPAGSNKCSDGLDNDCDGSIDLTDGDCLAPESCDGIDNDNDGSIDEDFGDLGAACSTGVGACHGSGVKVCSADATGTVCDAVIGLASPEGPAGVTCSDGIDNDCDGMTDGGDPGCGSAGLTVSCALPVLRGKAGGDCTAWHQIDFSVSGEAPGAVVTAELLAISLDGSLIESKVVQKGDTAHLASRIDPLDYKFMTTTSAKGVKHQVFAPVPMLRVTVDDGLNHAEAYCSNIPYLQVTQPSNSVVSQSAGDTTPIRVALPLVDTGTLAVKLDGVDLIAALGLDPAVAFPGGPYGGNVTINGANTTVSDLVVQSAGLDALSSNSLTMKVSNMGCGGHIVVVEGTRQAGSLASPQTPQCLVDDLRDKGVSMTLGIEITSPAGGSVTPGGPVQVIGEACHGRPITSARINGEPIPVAGQVLTAGDGEDSADTYTLPVSVTVPITDLRAEFNTGVGTPGTFDPGANRLFAQASDGDLNTTFDNLFFAVGPVLPISGAASTLAAGNDKDFLSGVALQAAVEVQKAFTLSLTPGALNSFFSAQCNLVGPDIASKVESSLNGYSSSKKISAICDPTVTTTLTSVSVDPNGFTCTATPMNDKVHIVITMPDISMTAHSGGYCRDTFLGVCTQSLTVNVDTPLGISGMSIQFDVTEASILNSSEITPVFDPGVLTKGSPANHSDVGCIVGALLDIGNFLAEIFTFGAFDPGPVAEAPVITDDLSDSLGLIEGDPFSLDLVNFDNENLPDFMLNLTSGLADVQINPQGITMAVTAIIEPTFEDPEVADVPGTPLTNAPLPQPPIPGAGDVTIAISDDFFNQIFAGMTKAGKLKTLFEDVRPLRSFFPADCSTVATPSGSGFCYAVVSTDTCFNLLPAGEARQACITARLLLVPRNLNGDTKMILHARVDNPPKLHIDDDAGTSAALETVLRLSQISLSLLADRDDDGVHEGTLESIPGCFAEGTPTIGECNLFEACMNLNMFADMTMVSGPGGKPAIHTDVKELTHTLSSGGLCNGAVDPDSATEGTITSAAESNAIDIIESMTGSSTPDLESQGLTFGGLVMFINPRLVAVENDGNPDFGDYLAITGDLAPNP